ncbi:hypothetical protein QBC38DRAFT_127186 [Podospora fimiseda]|uniref:Uncharacterized protein n=1 Tax=Podospora fimiseda TaxID=252190 RepID=A0AAN7GXC3_9PEZI|nr:hypothetical protein QBC38DRAFT_127186 [Podospora fimiseda]
MHRSPHLSGLLLFVRFMVSSQFIFVPCTLINLFWSIIHDCSIVHVPCFAQMPQYYSTSTIPLFGTHLSHFLSV